MADQLFQRQATVTFTVGDTVTAIKGLRTQFKVVKTRRSEPNTAEVSLYNLSPATRSLLKTRGQPFTLSAGYAHTEAQVFSGQARAIDHTRHGADWVTRLQAGDGEGAYRYSRLSKSFAKGISVADVAKELASQLGGLTAGSKKLLEGITAQFAQGFAAHGSVARQLTDLLKGGGLEWSIQDGQIQILRAGDLNDETAVLLSQDTGLVGSPEWGTPAPTEKRDHSHTLKVKSLLQPTLVPGGLAQVKAVGLPVADYVIDKVEHKGDSFGGEWYSEVECRVRPPPKS